MATNRDINKCKYIETKIDDAEAIIKSQPTKQTNKRNTLCNKQTYIRIILFQGKEKSLMKFGDTSLEKY